MKKPALLIAAVLVPAVVLLVLWSSLGDSSRTARGESAAAAPAQPPAPAAEAEPDQLSQPGLATPEDAEEGSSEAPGVARAAPREAFSGEGRRIRGTLRIPSGAPVDETLRVVALAEESSTREVYGQAGLLARMREGESVGKLVGSAPVDGAGAFDLALGSREEAWLVVDGRFLYSISTTYVEAGRAVELTSELGGCLTGSVGLPNGVEPSEESFDGTTITLGPDSQRFELSSLGNSSLFRRSTEVDAQGGFEFRALPAGPVHSLEVQCPVAARETRSGLEFEPGRELRIDVQLKPGATLRGMARDPAGAPLAEAEVVAAQSGMWGFAGDALASVKSAEDGRFELAHVPAGSVLLVGRKEGFLESQPEKLQLVDGEQREGLVVELGAGATVAGRVLLPDGAPAPQAEVKVSFDPAAMAGMGALNAARGANGKATTGPEGRFSVGGLGKGPFLVKASLDRPAPDGTKDKWMGKVAGVKPDTNDLEIELAAPNVLHGTVVQEDGTPVPEFVLRATLSSAFAFVAADARKQSIEDEGGAFALRDLEAGKWKVEASADGFGPMTPLEIDLPRADDTPVKLVLTPAATVSGTVVDPGGRPIAGARVTLHVDTVRRIEGLRTGASAPAASSTEDGSFLITGLASGTSALVASRDDYASSEPVSVESTPSAPATGVVLQLRRGALLTGEVFGADGKHAGGAQVVAQCQSNFETSMQRTDGEGSFRYEHLAPGSWTISAILSEGSLDTEGSAAEASASMLENLRFTMIQLADGDEEHVVLGAPPEDPVVVRGRVRHGGEPVTQGLVSFVPQAGKGMESFKMGALDEEGRYSAQLSAAGDYLVTVQVTSGGGAFQQNNVEFHETIPKVEEHVLDLSLPLGSLRGTVYGPDRMAMSGARVTLSTDGGIASGTFLGGHYAESTTDEDGQYAFEYLHPGTYSVAAGGALFGGAFGAASEVGRVVHSGLEVKEGHALEGVDFRLQRPGKIKGRVVDAASKPIGEAAIFVRDSSGHPVDRFSMITSSSDGSFTYAGLAEGEYVVSARSKGMASVESAPVRVREGESSEVEIVLFPGTRLEVEIEDGEGNPVNARVTVVDEHGREMQGMIGMAELSSAFGEGFDSRKQRVGPLPPGAYTVSAVADDGRKASKPVTVDGRPERRLTLRLR